MSADLTPPPEKKRIFSLSIGQLTFGSFILVLAVIIVTSTASVIAIRHIDTTFAELQRLQSVGDLAEDIDRRMNELRLAARDFVTDPGAGIQFKQVGEAASTLSDILKKTRIELAPEQQDMIDGVTERLATYRNGLERISTLIDRRAQLLAGLPPLRDQFDAAVSGTADRELASRLSEAQSRIALGLLARNPSAAEQAAQNMRTMDIADAKLRTAVNDYAEAIMAVAVRERQIADIDREVLGTEGRLIGRVTELLREVSARRGHVLSRDFARTLTEARWQSIVLGSIGVLIGILAAGFVVRRTVRPLAQIARSIRALAAGQKDTSIPSADVDNEIGDIARAAEVFRRALEEADTAREAAVRALTEQRLAEESYRKLFEGSVDGIYVTTPAGDLLNANPALARMMGYDSPQHLIDSINDIAHTIYVHPEARVEYQRLMHRDGMVREFEYQVRQRSGDILWLSDSATGVRDEQGKIIRYEGTLRDITDQKRAEDAIAEGRRLLQQVIDTVPAVINVKDRDLRYVLMNRYMAGIFGIEPGDALGRTTADLMSRYGAAKTDENDKRVLRLRKGLGFYEEEYKDASGNMRQWLVNKLPLLDAEGEIERIVTVALDIGERKRGEQEMRKAKESAETALRNLRETQASLIEAEKLAALGRLVRRRRSRGQQSRRHQPDGRLRAGAQDRDVHVRGRARRAPPLDAQRVPQHQPRRILAAGLQSQPRRRADPVVQAGRGRPQLFGPAQLRSRRPHRAGGDEPAAGPAQTQSDAQRRLPAQPDHEQLSRPVRAGADQPVSQFGGARLSRRASGDHRHPGARVRQGQCRDHLLRQRLRHVARRPPPRL
ncbi:PAS domain S-box-containing protein [Bradyrhizobium diazoefficiens]